MFTSKLDKMIGDIDKFTNKIQLAIAAGHDKSYERSFEIHELEQANAVDLVKLNRLQHILRNIGG